LKKKLLEKIILFNRKEKLIIEGDSVLVAFSGGPDSTFLLYSLKELKKTLKISDIKALHINHQLRGEESKRDEEFCKKFCLELGIEFFSEAVDVESFSKKEKKSIELSARELRYRSLEKKRKLLKFKKIATAHTMDDFCETVFFNFIRGAKKENLSGIPSKNENIIRPILPIKKQEILDFLHSQKIGFVIDSSNLKDDFSRNKIRNVLFPEIRKINKNFETSIFKNFFTSANLEFNFLDTRRLFSVIPKDSKFDIESYKLLEEKERFFLLRKIFDKWRNFLRVSSGLIKSSDDFLTKSIKKSLIISYDTRKKTGLILFKEKGKFWVENFKE